MVEGASVVLEDDLVELVELELELVLEVLVELVELVELVDLLEVLAALVELGVEDCAVVELFLGGIMALWGWLPRYMYPYALFCWLPQFSRL